MYDKVILPEQYRTGHEGVDEQHAHLFSILLGIINTIKNENNVSKKQIDAEANGLIRDLQSYTRSHFQYEEHLMEKSEYPYLEKHRHIHEGFKIKMGDLLNQATNKDETAHSLLIDMSNYIKTWYMEHVLSEDKKMVEFFKKFEKSKGK